MDFPKANNLQWLRLAFATQVVVTHASVHMGASVPGLIGHFPGVPAFFFVSGFLIYAAYKNAPGLRYFQNRFLRLFPGLLLVTLGALGVVLIAHGPGDLLDHPKTYVLWFLSQITLGQAYNPALFRDIGVGVINGSLWTLTVEILFYFSVPVIVWLEKRFGPTVLVLTVLSFAIYAVGPGLLDQRVHNGKTVYDVIALTPVPWGWMFGLGILAVKHYDVLARYLKYLPLALVPMVVMIFFGTGVVFGSEGNRLGLLYFLSYSAVVVWIAFGTPVRRLETDLSYGAYIWHMPIINLMLVLGVPNGWPIAIVATFLMAAASWFLIERPALHMKKRSLQAESVQPVESALEGSAARPN
jgi:peptidoglycan/LPS O-acetylase OafA/YrhL